MGLLIYFFSTNEARRKEVQTYCAKHDIGDVIFRAASLSGRAMNDVLEQCTSDYALVCREDVIFPNDIYSKMLEAIEAANEEYGFHSWGILGNSGVEFLSNIEVQFRSIDYSSVIPPRSLYPRPAVSLDGNVLLLSIVNLRERDIRVSPASSASELFYTQFIRDCYRCGLMCLLDSRLFVLQRSSTIYENDKQAGEESRAAFLKKNICYLKRDTEVRQADEYEYSLMKHENSHISKKILHKRIFEIMQEIYIKKEKKIVIVLIRTTFARKEYLYRSLDAIEIAQNHCRETLFLRVLLVANNYQGASLEDEMISIRSNYATLDITSIFFHCKEGCSARIEALRVGIQSIADNDDTYVWIVDDDDFIIPQSMAYVPFILKKDHISLGSSMIISEEYPKDYTEYSEFEKGRSNYFAADNFFKNYLGNNYIPVCSAVYPVNIIKGVMQSNQFKGDYFEDYALLLFASREFEIIPYQVDLCFVSYHGTNTVLETNRQIWDYSYATFISDVVQSGVVKTWEYMTLHEYVKAAAQLQLTSDKLSATDDQLRNEQKRLKLATDSLDSIQQTLLWRLAKKIYVFFDIFFPAGSCRRTLYNLVKKVLNRG